MATRLLTVGELAARSGVAVSALRFYEAAGLIVSSRTPGNQRRYARDALRRVAVIRAAQKLGVPLAVVHDALITLPAHRAPTAADWRRLAARWRGVLEARIAQLQALRDELTGCIGCGCLSLKVCPLRNPGDVLGRQGAGPRLLERGAVCPAPRRVGRQAGRRAP